MDTSTINSIMVLAIKAIEEPTYQDFRNKVARWYSSTYSVPLPDTDAIPDHELLKVYFEERYRELYDGDDAARRAYDETRLAVLNAFTGVAEANDTSDDEWQRQLEEEVKRQGLPKQAAPDPAQGPVPPPNLGFDIPDQGQVSVKNG